MDSVRLKRRKRWSRISATLPSTKSLLRHDIPHSKRKKLSQPKLRKRLLKSPLPLRKAVPFRIAPSSCLCQQAIKLRSSNLRCHCHPSSQSLKKTPVSFQWWRSCSAWKRMVRNNLMTKNARTNRKATAMNSSQISNNNRTINTITAMKIPMDRKTTATKLGSRANRLLSIQWWTWAWVIKACRTQESICLWWPTWCSSLAWIPK